MKMLKNLILASLVITFILVQPVNAKDYNSEAAAKKDYYASYYDEEGSLLFKIRGFYASTQAKLKDLPEPTNAGASKPGRIAQNGYGFDTAMTIFATDNIAAEISLGVGFYKTKTSVIQSAVSAYGTSSAKSVGKRNEILMVPATLALQYHIAPFGGIRPYIGAGYNGTYMYTRSKSFKANSGHGPVIQIGVDFVAKDDTLFTLDIRQYFLKSKLAFKKGLLGTAENISSTVAWNPLVISAGFGFKF